MLASGQEDCRGTGSHARQRACIRSCLVRLLVVSCPYISTCLTPPLPHAGEEGGGGEQRRFVLVGHGGRQEGGSGNMRCQEGEGQRSTHAQNLG